MYYVNKKLYKEKKMRYRRIRDLREDADLSQRQLAEELGMYKTTYARYETAERDIPLGFAIRLAKYYGVSLDYLAGLTDERN